MVAQLTLDQSVRVQILLPQPKKLNIDTLQSPGYKGFRYIWSIV